MGEARRGQSRQSYKGSGEMNTDQLRDTTVNPETRRLLQVKIEDDVKATGNVANLLFVVGLVSGGTGGVLFLLD